MWFGFSSCILTWIAVYLTGYVCRLYEVVLAMQRYGDYMQDGTKARETSWHALKLC
jgi:hypothetical protein